MGVPYCSGYLDEVTEKLAEDLNEELWKPEDLKIPVFHTESGMLYSCMHSCKLEFILRSGSDQRGDRGAGGVKSEDGEEKSSVCLEEREELKEIEELEQ